MAGNWRCSAQSAGPRIPKALEHIRTTIRQGSAPPPIVVSSPADHCFMILRDLLPIRRKYSPFESPERTAWPMFGPLRMTWPRRSVRTWSGDGVVVGIPARPAMAAVGGSDLMDLHLACMVLRPDEVISSAVAIDHRVDRLACVPKRPELKDAFQGREDDVRQGRSAAGASRERHNGVHFRMKADDRDLVRGRTGCIRLGAGIGRHGREAVAQFARQPVTEHAAIGTARRINAGGIDRILLARCIQQAVHEAHIVHVLLQGRWAARAGVP